MSQMIIHHESLPQEAQHVADVLRQVYEMKSFISATDFKPFYYQRKLTDGEGTFLHDFDFAKTVGARKVDGQSIAEHRFLLLDKDIYVPRRSTTVEDWAFGYAYPGSWLTVFSVARLRGGHEKRYLDRIARLAVHEIGHERVRSNHFKPAIFCKTDFDGNVTQTMELGEHCTDSRCAMYEVIDVQPKPNEFMLLGEEKRHDAYIDVLLDQGNYPTWLCGDCDKVAQRGDEARPVSEKA